MKKGKYFIIVGPIMILFALFSFSINAQIVTTRDKIVDNVIADDIVCDDKQENCTNLGKKVFYKYISNLQVDKQANEIITETSRQTGNKIKFYSGPTFYNDNGNWYVIETAKTTLEEWDTFTKQSIRRNYFNNYAYAQTIYSEAGDGICEEEVAGNNWETAHNATSSTGVGYITDEGRGPGVGITGGGYAHINRLFLAFDTSAITEEIETATINLYVADYVNDGDNDTKDYAVITSASQAATATLVEADFDQAGTIDNPNELSDQKDLGSVATSTYLTFNLNADGIGYINKSGYTKFGVREGHDTTDEAYAGSTGTFNDFEMRFSEYTGTGSDPYLEITLHQDLASGSISEDISSVSISNINEINLNFIIYLAVMCFLFITAFKLTLIL